MNDPLRKSTSTEPKESREGVVPALGYDTLEDERRY